MHPAAVRPCGTSATGTRPRPSPTPPPPAAAAGRGSSRVRRAARVVRLRCRRRHRSARADRGSRARSATSASSSDVMGANLGSALDAATAALGMARDSGWSGSMCPMQPRSAPPLWSETNTPARRSMIGDDIATGTGRPARCAAIASRASRRRRSRSAGSIIVGCAPDRRCPMQPRDSRRRPSCRLTRRRSPRTSRTTAYSRRGARGTHHRDRRPAAARMFGPDVERELKPVGVEAGHVVDDDGIEPRRGLRVVVVREIGAGDEQRVPPGAARSRARRRAHAPSPASASP